MAYLLNTSTTFLCLLFQWIIVFSIGAQESISTQLSNYTTTHATEKIFIHHDRAYYAQGDDIWYKVYLVDATHHFPINDGRLTDVELIDPSGNIISQQTLKMDTVNNHGQIAIGTNWKPGRYTLRAYTKYFDKTRSHNIFTKTLSIYAAEKLESTASGDISKKGKISIYPEGGDLISDVLQTVAIEFSGDTKRYAQGKVIDNRNQEITTFKLQQNGIGYFKLTTDPNKNYSVILTDGREEIKESIPVALKEGYVMSIENRHHDFFTLILEASPTLDLRDAFILIHLRGKEILKIDKLQNKEYPIKVSKENFKSGVFHITLFDKDSRPQCERLIFINKKDQELNAAVELSSQTYSRREEAQVMIDVDDQDGNAIHSNLSVAVVDNKLFPLDPLQSNISSHLLLESELGGPIDIAPLYLDEGADKSFLIDILMMTKGWRRFNWKDVLETGKPLVTSTSDKGFRISGVVSKKYRARKRVKSNVFLTVHGSQFEMHETLTDDDGRFTFTDVNIPDSTVLTIQANAYNEKKDLQDETQSGPNGNRSVDIHMDDSESLPVVLHSDKDKQVEVTDYKELVNLVTRKNDVLRVQSEGFSLNIEEVTIKGKRQSFYEKHDIERPLYHGVEYRIIPDSLAALNETATVFDLIRRKV